MAENKETDKIFEEFSLEVKRELVDIINDSPTLMKLGTKEFAVKNMRYYSTYRICKLALDMKKANESLDSGDKVIKAMCTDLDAMCEIVAVVLCNHMFVPDDIVDYDSANNAMSRNDKLVAMMKAKVMCSTFDENQWAAIVIAAIKSIDLGGFFLLKKSVSTLTDSILTRKKKSEETASLFMEAQSLQTQATSSERSVNTD